MTILAYKMHKMPWTISYKNLACTHMLRTSYLRKKSWPTQMTKNFRKHTKTKHEMQPSSHCNSDNTAHSNINHHSISSSKQKPISIFYISLPSVLYIFLPSLLNNIREALRFGTPQNIKDTSWVQLQRPAKDLQANHTIAA